MRLRAVVEYDGTNYFGFQVQPDRRTIQGTLESVLRRLTRENTRVVGAGRTDAGVHAIGQVIHFDTDWQHSLEEMEKGINALLPSDVAVRALEEIPEGFHARHSAASRTYRYVILSQKVRSPVRARFVHHIPMPLDVAAMRESSTCVPGSRDYGAFGQATVGSSTVRTVHRVEWCLEDGRWGRLRSCFADTAGQDTWSSIVCFEIEASGYLRGMVRRLVGTMLWVGMGRLSPEEFREILDSADIARAAPPAPACGLCLVQVKY